jgi:hypothetical protein
MVDVLITLIDHCTMYVNIKMSHCINVCNYYVNSKIEIKNQDSKHRL